jgi:hypothetical protein
MLKVLKIHEWENCPPFKFYLNPLKDSINKVRKELLDMHKRGDLFNKYIIENNEELQKYTIEMVKKDNIAQWLVGDELKQDQFKFMYESMKVIYDSAVKEKLLKSDETVLTYILNKIVAFRAIMVIRNIQLRKANEFKKIKEKAEVNGVPPSAIQKDPMHMTEEELIAWRME